MEWRQNARLLTSVNTIDEHMYEIFMIRTICLTVLRTTHTYKIAAIICSVRNFSLNPRNAADSEKLLHSFVQEKTSSTKISYAAKLVKLPYIIVLKPKPEMAL